MDGGGGFEDVRERASLGVRVGDLDVANDGSVQEVELRPWGAKTGCSTSRWRLRILIPIGTVDGSCACIQRRRRSCARCGSGPGAGFGSRASASPSTSSSMPGAHSSSSRRPRRRGCASLRRTATPCGSTGGISRGDRRAAIRGGRAMTFTTWRRTCGPAPTRSPCGPITTPRLAKATAGRVGAATPMASASARAFGRNSRPRTTTAQAQP